MVLIPIYLYIFQNKLYTEHLTTAGFTGMLRLKILCRAVMCYGKGIRFMFLFLMFCSFSVNFVICVTATTIPQLLSYSLFFSPPSQGGTNDKRNVFLSTSTELRTRLRAPFPPTLSRWSPSSHFIFHFLLCIFTLSCSFSYYTRVTGQRYQLA